MKIAKETFIATESQNNLLSELYTKVSISLDDKVFTLKNEWVELLDYHRNLENEKASNNKRISMLKVKHKRDVFKEVNSIYEDFQRLDLFVEHLAERDEDDKSFIDIEESDIKNRLNKSMLQILNDSKLYDKFISIIKDSLLQNDFNNFYFQMCDFFQFIIDDVPIEHFKIYSEMARVLTNDLFDTNIKAKNQPQNKIISSSKYNRKVTHKRSK